MIFQEIKIQNSENSAWDRIMEFLDTNIIPVWVALVLLTLWLLYNAWRDWRIVTDASKTVGDDNGRPPERTE